MNLRSLVCLGLWCVLTLGYSAWAAGEIKVTLTPLMVTNEAGIGTPEAMVDEQDTAVSDPPTGAAKTIWAVPSNKWKTTPIVNAYVDLGEARPLGYVWIYDSNGVGDLVISSGRPGEWTEVATYDCKANKTWKKVDLGVETRYLRFTRKDGGSNINEIALYAYTSEQWPAIKQQKADEAKARELAKVAAAKTAAEREAGLARGKAESQSRPVIDLGEPFGKVQLVDEVNVASDNPGHGFVDDPAGVSQIQTILGKPCRVLNKTPDEGAYMTFRLGQYKLIKPGASYVLEVEYPDDAPRSMVIQNSGNETARGFHTGAALGDAFYPKYVNNLNESLRVPLSGKYQTWTMFFNLHDRFPALKAIRGSGERALTSEDGFPVTICQFSAENIPLSQGATVSRIRLFEVSNPASLNAVYHLPPADLPRRHLFWREEMADGVVDPKQKTERALKDPLDWYRYKANLMQFLGMHTYTKDLLEFGSCQGWDPTAYGGNKWVFFNGDAKDWWGQIVQIMGERGFEVLPYYEYAGSKGQQGLGPQRRAKPLTRDDAFTHIKWIESSNADITDPDTYADFKKMLDLTVIQYKDKAHFVGAWLRPRSQLPMGFGDSTRKRFADEANKGREITRQQLREDQVLLKKYESWWLGKRRDFLVAMRDYLREKGVTDATILFTTCASEPGVGFGTFDPLIVTDDPQTWSAMLAASPNEKDKKMVPLAVDDVIAKKMYLNGLLSPPLNWGDWEINHANPQADPEDYKSTEGVLLTHAINRLYTVADPETFDAFRAPSGLAVIRHYSLNENMMFDKADKPKLGYFVADIERAGPHCMMAEAMAMANGDPRFIGYLVGLNYGRGFPKYVRDFNTAFLSLPAAPSQRLADASSDAQVVVRSIPTGKHGTYLAIVNAGMTDKTGVEIKLPTAGKVTDAASGQVIDVQGGKVQMTLYPWQLRALHIESVN